jgi:hypothetical protein
MRPTPHPCVLSAPVRIHKARLVLGGTIWVAGALHLLGLAS